MIEKIKSRILKYFHTKKPLSIISDFVFIILVVLLIIPGTRKDVASFFIRLTSFAPSELSTGEQYTIRPETKTWSFTSLSGKEVVFDEFLDKPVFLNIWATWCPPCIAELPGIKKLYNEYKGKVNFILLSDEPDSTINKFIIARKYRGLPFYRYNSIPQDFSTRSIPASYIITRYGKVVLKKKGAASWDSGKVKALLDELIKMKKP